MALLVRDAHKYLGRARFRPQTITGRLRRVGKNIVDPNGNNWVPRGYNYGEDMLWTQGADFAADAAAGANCVRIVFRGWGGNALPKLDGQQDGALGDYSNAQWARARAMLKDARAHGLRVIAAFDSDCGQNAWQGYPDDPTQWNFCSIVDQFGVPQGGQNLWTPLGQDKRRRHINHQRMFLRVFHGLIDIVEPIVEPNPSATGHFQKDVNAYWVEAMASNLKEDPGVLHAVGGQAYRNSVIADPMLVGTAWPTDQFVLTWDFLDNSMSDSDAAFDGYITFIAGVRDTYVIPVFCNQFGIQQSTDVDGAILKKRINSMLDAPGGAMGWAYWEKVSKTVQSYGPWQDSTDYGTNRNYANAGPARQGILEAGFKGRVS